MHILLILYFYLLTMLLAISIHSGYEFYGFPCSIRHDYHHQVPSNNFAVNVPILDYLHGTDIQFRLWRSKFESKKEALNDLANKTK